MPRSRAASSRVGEKGIYEATALASFFNFSGRLEAASGLPPDEFPPAPVLPKRERRLRTHVSLSSMNTQCRLCRSGISLSAYGSISTNPLER
jgi:hypothetical protein